MSIIKGIKYSQNNQIFISTVMKVEDILRISKALIYGKDDFGYQRALNKKHCKKISESIKKNSGLISPTSIVLGIDESKIKTLIDEYKEEQILNLNIDEFSDESFRIIDGQHRIEGFKEAIETSHFDENLKEYMLNVIIMVIDENKKTQEVKVFRDINSKAKPLKVDLAILALYEYEKRCNENLENFNLGEYIAIKTAYKLNENKISYNDKINVWQNGIILDPNADKKIAIIGFKTFCESINGICDLVVNYKELSNRFDNEYIEIYSNEIIDELIQPCWNIIYDKWRNCFEEKYIKNEVSSVIYHNKDYYLQKTIGTKSIHLLIKDIFKSNNGDYKNSVSEFEEYIKCSELNSNDWISGGRFSGLSSEAGIKKVKEIILNKK